MKYLAAYTLLALSSKTNISIPHIIQSPKISKASSTASNPTATDDELNRAVEALKGKTLHQLIAEGNKRFGSSGPVVSPSAEGKEYKKEAFKK